MPPPPGFERLARECEITPYKSSGPGGQKKNKTESSVRVRHLPSGIVRIATESRSQARNRETALARVLEELKRRARKPKPRRPPAAASSCPSTTANADIPFCSQFVIARRS